MKNRINLLSKQEKYLKLESLFQKLRLAILILGVVVFSIDVIFFGVLIQQKRELDAISSEKKKLLDFLVANKDVEAKYVYFRSKEKQIITVLKNDVRFYPYYNLLNQSLNSASPAARLESVIIDKNREVEFTVGFDDFSALAAFFKFAESETFLANFTTLNLGGFNIAKQGKKVYELAFKGKFNEIK